MTSSFKTKARFKLWPKEVNTQYDFIKIQAKIKMLPLFAGVLVALIFLLFLYLIVSEKLYQASPVEILSEAVLPKYAVSDFMEMYSFNQDFNKIERLEFVEVRSTDNLNKNLPQKSQKQVMIGGTPVAVPELPHTGVNEHYIGQLSIPELGITDALYYTGDDYYLQHNRNGKSNAAGELYIDGRSSGNLNKLDNLVNGHSMNNGSKFGKLHKVSEKVNPVYIFLEDYATQRTYVYQIFSANLIDNKNSGVYLSFNSTYERNLYYQKLKSSSIIRSDIVDFSRSILTLNTCDYSIKDGHLIVSAILIGWR